MNQGDRLEYENNGGQNEQERTMFKDTKPRTKIKSIW